MTNLTRHPLASRKLLLLGGVLAAAVLTLAVAAAAASAATLGVLRVGTTTGSEDYLYTAGNTVSTSPLASPATKAAYRFKVVAPSGAVARTSACSGAQSALGAADSYTVSAGDLASGATGYQYQLEEFSGSPNQNTNLANCNVGSGGTIVDRRYFDVVTAQVDGATSFTGSQRLFAPTATAYTRYSGAANRNPTSGAISAGSLWNVTWLNGAAPQCANTSGSDRPDSSATAQLPAGASAYLQFPPSTAGTGAYNLTGAYDATCPPSTTGAYGAALRLSATQFVQLDSLFTVDATPPAVDDDPIADTNVNTPALSGAAGTQAATATTFADGNQVTVNVYSGSAAGGSPVRSFTTTASGSTWSIAQSDWAGQAQSPLGDGVYTVQAQQSDGGGNAGFGTARVFKVDTTRPAVTLTAPAAELASSVPQLSGAAGNLSNGSSLATSDSATVTVKIYAGNAVAGMPVRTIPVQRTSNQWTAGAAAWAAAGQAALPDGTYTAQAEQLDAVGNVGTSVPAVFKVDTAAPVVTVTSPPDGTAMTGGAPALAGGAGTVPSTDSTATDLSPVTVKVYSGADTSGGVQRQFTVSGAGGAWSVPASQWAGQELSQGQWTIQAEQSDSAGNVGHSLTRTIRVDTDFPTSTTSSPSATNASPFTVSYSDTDNGSSQSGVASIQLYVLGPGDSAYRAVAGASATNPAATGSLSFAPDEGEGRYFFATVATDRAGNTEPAPSGSGKANTHYDVTAPAPSMTGPAAMSNVSAPALSGSAGAENGNGVPAADLTDVTVEVWAGSAAIGLPARTLTATRAGSSWSISTAAWSAASSTTAPLTEGTWTIRARQSDAAGNTGATTAQTFVVDVHAPQTTDDVSTTTYVNHPVTVHLSSTDSGGGSVAAIHYTTNGATPTLASPTYSDTAPPQLASGERIRYFAVDTAGNQEPVELSAPALVDQQTPVTGDNVPVTWVPSDVSVALSPSDAGGSGLDGTYYTTDDTAPTLGSSTYDPANPPVLHNGQRVRYFSTDRAGNREQERQSPYAQVDKLAPVTHATVSSATNQQSISVSYSAADAASGVKKVELWVQTPTSGTWTLASTDSAPGSSGSFTYNATGDGVYQFYTVGEDQVGNRETVDTGIGSSQVSAARLDTVAPSTTDDVPSAYVNDDIVVHLSASDASGSGVTATRYTLDGSTPTASSPSYDPASPPHLTSDGQQIRYFSVDAAGNAEPAHTATARIDRAAPATQVGATALTANPSMTVGYTAIESGGSGLARVDLYAKGPSDVAYSRVAQDFTPAASGRSFAYTAAQGDGPYRFYTVGVDGAANVEGFDATKVVTTTLDTQAPAPTLTTPDAGALLATDTPALAGAAGTAPGDDASVTVRVYAGSTATGSPVQAKQAIVGSGAWSVTTNHLGDGVYTAQAEQADSAGNHALTNPRTFTVDATAPQPSVTAPDDNSSTNATAPTLSGTAGDAPGDAANVTVRVYDAGGSAVQTASVARSGATWSVSPSTLVDGTYTVDVEQYDAAGNHSKSAARHFTVDTQAPVPTVAAPADNSSTKVAATPLSGTAGSAPGDAATVTVTIRAGGSVVQTLTPTRTVASWSATPAALPDGTYSVDVAQSDAAGNHSTSPTRTFTVDTQAPQPTVTGPADNSASSDAAPTLAGTAGNASGDASSVTVHVYSGADAVQTKTVSRNGGSTWSVAADHLADGTYSVDVEQTDAAGNDATSPAHAFTVDTQAPQPTVTVPADNSATNDDTPALSGTAGNASGDSPNVAVRVHAGAATIQTKSVARSGGAFSVDADHLADGTYSVDAEQSDAVGNHQTSAAHTFQVDTATPASDASSPGLSNDTTVPVAYTAADDNGGTGLARVELWVKGPGTTAYAKAMQVQAPGASGSFSYVADHGDGTYRFYTLAIDRAGNVEAAPSADSSTRVAADQLDSHAPGISSPNQGASYQQNASAAAAFTCTDEAGGSGVASCDGSVANGAALDTSTAGQRSFTVTATDRAGNTRTATIAYAVSEQHVEGEHHDTSAPHLNTTATKRNQPLRGSALSVDVSCDEACTLSAGGTISVPGAAKVHRLKTAAGRGGQGSHVRLAPRLDRATLRAVRKALKRRGRVVAKLTVSATDAAGNVRTTTLTLRVTKA